jgi:hypothetical protein
LTVAQSFIAFWFAYLLRFNFEVAAVDFSHGISAIAVCFSEFIAF